MPAPIETFTFVDEPYRAPRLSAFDQHAVLRLLNPVLDDFRQRTQRRARRLDMPLRRQVDALNAAVANIEASTLSELFTLCLARVERKDGDEWRMIWSAEDEMPLFEDLTAGRLVALVVRTVLAHLTPFFARKTLEFQPTRGASYEPVGLYDGLSWLLMPVERGMCHYESLKDGTLDLVDIALMNDQIAVAGENSARAQKAAQREAEGRTR